MVRDFELALIPARGGSKGLPGKNLRPLGGIPLIAWTIRAALKADVFDKIVVSTDDLDIAKIAEEAGALVPFLRPAALANDTATSDAVVAHALEKLGVVGNFALLQPTSPFRSDRDIREAARLFKHSEAVMVLGVGTAKPIEWLLVEGLDGFLRPALAQSDTTSRRQDALIPLMPNGSLYMTSAVAFRANGRLPSERRLGYRMSAVHSLDIDDIDDFRLAEALISQYGSELLE